MPRFAPAVLVCRIAYKTQGIGEKEIAGMEYNFKEIEARWQQRWAADGTYHVVEDMKREKYYVLNMFPYPSGAGLHVGHPLGYIATDIFARYKRLKGYNVLNPMGYDAYGLPAEQYAIATGQHPDVTTRQNIARYREQLDRMGFSFDWTREVRTCDPSYYHWTQWAFIQMYNSFYCCKCGTAMPISDLIEHFARHGTNRCYAYCTERQQFTADEWCAMTPQEQSDILMHYRIAFLAETTVNWCEALGTVLANDEVQEGVSIRGGYPVVQKTMRQWCLRVSAYAERLLAGLDSIAWSDAIKDTQRHWIGRSEGAEIEIRVQASDVVFTIFTTRADTLFGVTFFVLAPESDIIDKVCTAAQRQAVDDYLRYVKGRSERQRMIDHTVTGVFTGAYGINPLTQEACPIYVAEYVLAGYGTGAIMAVPAHDARDYAFAKHFSLPIIPLIKDADISHESYDAKEGTMMNSPAEGKTAYKDFSINGLSVHDAIEATKQFIAREGLGRIKVNYRLRDAIFSRQRYWGEPFPVYYKQGIPMMVPDACLPLLLPQVEKFLPTATGEPPLGNAQQWAWDERQCRVVDKALISDDNDVYPLELNTMPGFAGSAAYYLRYMDPHNSTALVSKENANYWRAVDLYVGGAEHATGHLIYSRFWNKFLYDIGVSPAEEPFERLINQGMIQGRSNFVYRIKGTNTFVSVGQRAAYDTTEIHVDVNIVHNDILDIDAFRAWREEYKDAEFILDDGRYVCGWAVEKMSKSMYNVVNPDTIIDNYGADTLRLYEMFLGPVEQSKPWDTNGIDGCHRFLKKFWALFYDKQGRCLVDDSTPTADNNKTLHKLIKKVSTDIEAFSFNTAIAAFMIATAELAQQQCRSREVLEQVVVLLAPFAPHIAEELYATVFGHDTTVCDASWPLWDEQHLVETMLTLPVQFNGKVRYTISCAVDTPQESVIHAALHAPQAAKYLAGKEIVKTIVVPNKIINIVVKG